MLQDDTLFIPAGQKVALVGQIGAGKSTLLDALYRRASKTVALIAQEYGMVVHMSVFHNVYVGQVGRQPFWYNWINLYNPLEKPVIEVREILKKIQLEDNIFDLTGILTGSQQQRVAIARAMMMETDVLLADDPISSQDESLSRLVMDVLFERFDTIVMALHNVDLALEYCDRIIGLEHGKIVIDAPSDSLNRDDLLKLYGTENKANPSF